MRRMICSAGRRIILIGSQLSVFSVIFGSIGMQLLAAPDTSWWTDVSFSPAGFVVGRDRGGSFTAELHGWGEDVDDPKRNYYYKGYMKNVPEFVSDLHLSRTNLEFTIRPGAAQTSGLFVLTLYIELWERDNQGYYRITHGLSYPGMPLSVYEWVAEFNACGGQVEEKVRGVTDIQWDVGPDLSIDRSARISSLPRPWRNGYFFDGWWTSEDGGEMVTDGYIIRSSVTFYAHWIRGRYIEFDANGGVVDLSGKTYHIDEAVTELPTPTREHYEFLGWHDEFGQKVEVPFVVPDRDLKLKAYWRGNLHTVTFDAMGGECDVKSDGVRYGAYYGDQLPSATRSGYRFLGWFMEKDGNRNANDVTVTGDATLYAHWSTLLQLVFDANGGTSSAQSRFVEYGQVYGELPSASREGYDFAGWYTAASGGTKVDATTAIKLDGETIYAHWKAHRYSINVNANGAEGSVDGLMLSYGVEIDLPASGLTRAGYAFAGWALSSTGSVVYPVGKKVGNVTSVDGVTVTLYAIWAPVPLTVSYARQHYPWNGLADVVAKVEGDAGVNYQVSFQVADADGEVKSVESIHAVGQTQIQRVQTLANGEYAFVWDVANDLAAGYKSSGLKMRAVAYDKDAQEVSHSDWVSMGTVNLGDVAGRVAGKLPLAYGSDWVSGGAKSVIKANGAVIAELTGKGVFEWMGDAGQTYTLTLEILNSSGARVGDVYSVTWEWVTRSTLTFVGNIDGVGTQARVYDDTYAYGEFPHVGKPCYDFLGWFTSATGGDRVQETDISDVSKTLYGHWQASGYQIVFDANGGTGEMSSQVIRTGEKTALAECTYGVSDSACIGWSMTPDGPVQFKNGEEVLDLVPITKDLKLYAVWALEDVDLKSFRQRYPWNGLVDIDFVLTGVAGRNYTLLVQARDNVGGTNLNVRTVLDEKLEAKGNPLAVSAGTHRIVWNADADLSDGFKCDDVSVRLAFVTTVEFDACGGQCDIATKQYVLGDSYEELPTPTKSGCVFKGWYSDAEYKVSVTTESLAVPSATVLYAKWEAGE